MFFQENQALLNGACINKTSVYLHFKIYNYVRR